MKPKLVWVVVVIAVIVAAIAAYQIYINSTAIKPAASKNYKVIYGSISSIVSATGTINAVDSVDVGSNTNGQLKKVYVKQNDKVFSGQMLAEIDSDKIKNELQQAIFKADNLGATYQRQQNLYKRGAIAKQDLETAQLNYNLATEDVAMSRKTLTDTVITAPMSGTVIGEPMSEGQTIGGSNLQTILTIANLSKMKVVALIDESDVGKVRVGQKAEFTIDAFQYTTFSGTVNLISNLVTTQSGVNYYKVEISVDKNKYDLRPGMTARVSIVTGKNDHALVVPLLAIKEANGKQFVEIDNDAKLQRHEVRIGLTNDENAEIISGLKENDVIQIPLPKTSSGSSKPSRSGSGGPPRMF